MLKCNNCNRVYKGRYQRCPVCNSTSFSEIEYKNNFVVKYDRYVLMVNKAKESMKKFMLMTIIPTILLIIIVFLPSIREKISYSSSLGKYAPFLYVFIIMGVFSIITTIYMKINKKKSKLIKNGVLIKNLNYEIISYQNKPNKFQIRISYMDETGSAKTLYSDGKTQKNNELNNIYSTADLLVDPNNNNDYYIDFEIY